MSCYKPLEAFRLPGGGVTFKRSESTGITVPLPCGRCIGCRIDRSRQWAVRCMHEASLWEHNSFVTLTYNDENLPEHRTLDHRDFQLFMKRLRKRFPHRIRFYMCGEYGEQCADCGKSRRDCTCYRFTEALGRPHYHALLFNLQFPDMKLWKKVRENPVFTSDILSGLWGKGFATIGSVTFQSAAYVARYILKKQTGDFARARYETQDEETGEIYQRRSEYTRMSRADGIGKEWFDRFGDDVYPDDFCVHEGKRYKTPRYYDKQLKKKPLGEEYLAVIKRRREDDAKKRAKENTPERLAVREVIQQEKIDRLKREKEPM